MGSSAIRLAERIALLAPAQPDELTHLKLQKLAFYCYGALLAFDVEREVGQIEFQAWKHGPVNAEIFRRYSPFGKSVLPRPESACAFGLATESAIRDVLNVYGRLTAWQLREESHVEEPWRRAFTGARGVRLDDEELRAHFKLKFATGRVRFPERLFGTASMALDRIPVPTFGSLAEMADAATSILD